MLAQKINAIDLQILWICIFFPPMGNVFKKKKILFIFF